MRSRLAAALVLLLATAAAQPAPANGLDTRLTIVETRLGRLEADVSQLREVPTALARIEEKVTALTERTGGLDGRWNSITGGIMLALGGGAIGALFRPRPTPKR